MTDLLQRYAGKTASALGHNSKAVQLFRPMYESLLDWASLKKGIPWSINGVEYRVDPHHRHRLGHEYDPPVASLLAKLIQPGWVCVDVGANVGVYVLQLARWSGPDGYVVAFEPNPEALKALHRHIRLNGFDKRVRVEPFAIAESGVAKATLFRAGADGMSRLGEPNQALASSAVPLEVDTTSLDAYCSSKGLKPNLLLLDIEGFEIAALSSARKLIQERGTDLEIIVEMHPSVWTSADTNRRRAELLLSELRRIPVPLTGQADPLGDHGTVRLVPA
jgi:FkbM family methyltransferase